MVPQVPNGDQPILATIAGVSSQTGVAIPILNPAAASVTGDACAGASSTIRCGATVSFTAKVANTTDSAVAWQSMDKREAVPVRDHLCHWRLHRARRSAESRGGNRDRRQPRRPHGQGQRGRESAEPSAGCRVGDSQPGESRQGDHYG